jgi:uncharacterized membrane protein YqaE (UPF0057 family)
MVVRLVLTLCFFVPDMIDALWLVGKKSGPP